jgi:hypothetical protein
MKKRRWLVVLLLLLAFSHISCSWEKYEYPPGRIDEEKLAEALASREQEDPAPLTMLQAYQIAQERATKWSDDSYLIEMRYVFGISNPYEYWFRTPNKWGWSCVGGPAYTDLDIWIDPLAGKVTNFQEAGQPDVGYGHIEPNTWNIDSPEALEIAEANGGQIFNEKYPECSKITKSEWSAGWEIIYDIREKLERGEKLIARFWIAIDPFNGSTRIIEDTDGVSGEKVIIRE